MSRIVSPIEITVPHEFLGASDPIGKTVVEKCKWCGTTRRSVAVNHCNERFDKDPDVKAAFALAARMPTPQPQPETIISTTVGGLDNWLRLKSNLLDTSEDLNRCKTCGYIAGYRLVGSSNDLYHKVECTNTSCGVSIPSHYRNRKDAAYAWNRTPGSPPARHSVVEVYTELVGLTVIGVEQGPNFVRVVFAGYSKDLFINDRGISCLVERK